jgi:uncharacterized membrane protein (UPF0127 family)
MKIMKNISKGMIFGDFFLAPFDEKKGFGKIIGLMFTKKEKTYANLFRFSRPTRMSIHSFFVDYDFLAVWCDYNGKIIESKIIKPWTLYIAPKGKFSFLIEIPTSLRYKELIGKILSSAVEEEKI